MICSVSLIFVFYLNSLSLSAWGFPETLTGNYIFTGGKAMKRQFFQAFMMIVILFAIQSIVYAQLDVKGPGSDRTTFTLILKNNSSDTSVAVRDDRRVGIWTTNPLYPLDVNGYILARSGIRFTDSSVLAKAGGTLYARVYTVAKSGGDFTTVTAALGICTGPSSTNQYMIRVMPGVYNESFACRQYVHISGSGKYTTTISGQVTTENNHVLEGLHITQGVKCPGKSPTILNNRITNSTGDGIEVSLQGKPWIRENEIDSCSGWGIQVKDFGSDPWIISNKIIGNTSGGIRLENTSPTISNNFIDNNHIYGIYMIGGIGMPTEPTIDDNVIGHTDYNTGGIGIRIVGYAEPRIIANDIYLNECGIWIDPNAQPSVTGNNLNYNFEAGIRCFSNGASKRPVISFNHLHSNCHMGGWQPAGVWIQNSTVILTHNNISQNDPTGLMPDIDYSFCVVPSLPTISLNVYDMIFRVPGPGAPTATGQYNVTTQGVAINP
jgi:parallel beta-helix repeat protein